MKAIISSVALVLLLAISTSSHASENPIKKSATTTKQKATISSKPTLELYFWIFYGPCLQLVRLNPPGYTDAQGNYWPNASLTFMMNGTNYAGTTQICPPEGEAYC
jgi:hypothetical protein